MPTTIPLQDSVVYGPIPSRRLGASLGINVLPTTSKVCSSNCVYCQYGWTVPARQQEPLKRAPQLLQEIDAAFQAHAQSGQRIDCITLAGNGEPTLHPDLEAIVDGLKTLRDRYFPRAKVGILTDATQITRPRVRQALAQLDVRYMKLDAGDEETWKAINLPLGQVSFDAIIDELARMPDIILQSMFIQGSYDNTHQAHVDHWVQTVRRIHPLSVQVYTVDRGTAADGITEVPRATLQAIADQLTAATGIPAEVYD